MKQKKHTILENAIYLLIWLVVFLIPLFTFREDGATQWVEVRRFWLIVSPFFVLFLINNYCLIPLFLLKKRYLSYFLIIALVIVVLFLSLSVIRENAFPHPPYHGQLHQQRTEPKRPPKELDPRNLPMPEAFPPKGGDNMKPGKMLPPFRRSPVLFHALLAFLIVGVNIAIRYLFKSIDDDRQMKEMESQSLKAELNYLKAQVNPHFFMNTLNNIHALIDIDTEKAKETIIELSKIMRYVLYEGNMPLVSLVKEIHFLDNYIALMRIRYTDEVEIRTVYPHDDVSGIMLPPLMLIALLENAFKHGISYQSRSYVFTELSVNGGRIGYHVRNSISKDKALESGMGLENLRKRLSLLYGKDYSLTTESENGEYNAILIIPVTYDAVHNDR